VRRTEKGGIFFKLLFLVFFLGFIALVYVSRRPLLRFAGEFWVVDEPTAPSDALIVLGDDNYSGDRAFHAAELYREGVAPVVVASGRMLRQNVSMADVMEHDLQSFGVPATAVVKLSHRAGNTREEADEAARLIQARGWKRLLVVTSNYHARRARFIYGKTLSPNVILRVAGARDSEFDPLRWWESRQGQKLFLTEVVGYVVAAWELRDAPSPRDQSSLLPWGQLSGMRASPQSRLLHISDAPVSNWQHAGPWDSPGALPADYSSQVTVLSGLLHFNPSPVATEFSVGG
jgi:hypothetical protein